VLPVAKVTFGFTCVNVLHVICICVCITIYALASMWYAFSMHVVCTLAVLLDGTP
jgi:hypothetical protein